LMRCVVDCKIRFKLRHFQLSHCGYCVIKGGDIRKGGVAAIGCFTLTYINDSLYFEEKNRFYAYLAFGMHYTYTFFSNSTR